MSFALLLSRLSGMVREQVLGARLGLSAEMDAAVLILTLPDLLVGLLLSGGFAAALVPALTRAEHEARVQLTRRAMGWTGLVSLALAALLFAGMPNVLSVLSPTTDTHGLIAFPLGFGLSLLALPMAAIIGVSSSYLNTVGKYSVPALAVLCFNAMLASYFYFGLGTGPVNFCLFGLAILLSTIARFGIQVWFIPDFTRRGLDTYRFERIFPIQFAQGVLGAAVLVGIPIIFRSLYAGGGTGDLATFNYAMRLFELPMGIMVAPIIVIFLPLLANLRDTKAPIFFWRINLAIRTAFTLGLTGALVGAIYARPISAVLFGFGELAGNGADEIAKTFQVIILALPFMAVFQAASTGLNASHRPASVLVYSIISLALSLALYVTMRSSGVSISFAAEAGFISFSVLASGLGLYGVLHRTERFQILRQLTIIAIRTGATALPFMLIFPESRDGEVELMDFVAIGSLGLAILIVNLAVFKELAAISDKRS